MASGGLAVHHVLSGTLAGPVAYLQDEDELALVLEGEATLEVEGEAVDLHEGDWVWLPAGVPHRLLATARGTRWLTVHHQIGG